MCELLRNERVDDIQIGGLKLIQLRNGYRFSIDPILLADFIVVRNHQAVVDLGTGSGILPLLIAKRTTASSVIGIELQQSLFDRARRNIELNGLTKKVDVRCLDVRDIANEACFAVESFDVAVMNPPYRSSHSGRISFDDERAICRHELNGDFKDFLFTSRWLVRQGGSVNVVFLAERLPELLREMQAIGLEPKRLRMVHSDREREAHLVLVEARKAGRPGLKILPPLFIYADGEYSEEIRRIFDVEQATKMSIS